MTSARFAKWNGRRREGDGATASPCSEANRALFTAGNKNRVYSASRPGFGKSSDTQAELHKTGLSHLRKENLPSTKPTVAVFDFDGTITYADSFVPFLREASGRAIFVIKLILLGPILICGAFGFIGRKRLKEHLIRSFLSGKTITTLQIIGERFCANRLQCLLNPVALQRINWHRQQGHRLILLSASPEVYLTIWAAKNGIFEVIATRLQISGENITGYIDGENCRGPEKVKRLEAHLGHLDQYVLYAYGDSPADLELLQHVSHPFYRSFLLDGGPIRPFHTWGKFLRALV